MTKENTTQGKSGNNNIASQLSVIKEWFHYLLSKWYWIVLFGILGAAIGFWYAKIQKPVYTATTSFVLETAEKGGSGLGQYAGIAAMMGLDVGGSGGLFQGENILELYKSRSMIAKTLLTEANFNGNKQLLIDRYLDITGLRASWKNTGLKNIQFLPSNIYEDEKQQLLHDSIISLVAKDIGLNYLNVIKPDKKLNIIFVYVSSTDPLFAKFFNEQIVQNVNNFYLQTKTKKTSDNIAILQQKADSVRSLMTGAIYQTAQTIDATPNLNPTRQVQRIAPVQKAQASVEINKAILSQLVQNLELSKISLQKETPLIQIVDSPVLPLEYKKLRKLNTMLIGGAIGGFLVLLILIVRKLIKSISIS